MLLFVSQLTNLYPNLALFTKEKGWRCGKSFISYRSKCYRNPKTGKIATKYIVNPKTGRKNKIKVGLDYKEYQKARKSAIKKKGQGKRITGLEKKYIADADRLATSVRKKKKRRLDAKNKRKINKAISKIKAESKAKKAKIQEIAKTDELERNKRREADPLSKKISGKFFTVTSGSKDRNGYVTGNARFPVGNGKEAFLEYKAKDGVFDVRRTYGDTKTKDSDIAAAKKFYGENQTEVESHINNVITGKAQKRSQSESSKKTTKEPKFAKIGDYEVAVRSYEKSKNQYGGKGGTYYDGSIYLKVKDSKTGRIKNIEASGGNYRDGLFDSAGLDEKSRNKLSSGDYERVNKFLRSNKQDIGNLFKQDMLGVDPEKPLNNSKKTRSTLKQLTDNAVNKTTQSKSQINNYEDYKNTFKRIQDGDITADEIRQAQLDLRNNEAAVKADLNKFKKDKLIRMAGWGVRPSDKKERMVESSYERLEQLLLPPGDRTLGYSYEFGEDGAAKTKANRHRAIDKQMAEWTDEKIQEAAAQRKAAKAEKEKAIADPKTIDDFRTLVREKGLNGLEPKQRRTYEELVTVKNRAERKKSKPKIEAVELPSNDAFNLAQTKHTKKGHDVYVASLKERVDRDKYNELNRRAKSLGGYYSRYGRDGAIPGFQFRDEETAKKFMGLEETEGKDRTGEKQQKQSNNLRTNAERLIERNEEKLNQPRLMNTARRARMGASVMDDARGEIAIGKTMLKLADAKEKDTVQFLDRVSAGIDVRQLSGILGRTRWKAARKISEEKYPDENDYYKRKKVKDDIEGKPIDDDIIEYAEYPYPSIHKERLRDLLNEAENQNGMKLLSNRLRKKYRAIANKDRESIVTFEKGKDIEDFKKLLKAKYTSTNKYHAESGQESIKDYQRIHDKLDLKTPYELRAGLREFNRLRSSKAKEDPIKVLERELVGRKIDGYFPTPKPLVNKMLDLADLKPGQRVLEPSAGKGNIADELRKVVGNDTVQTIEIDRDLSKILDEKGYNNRRDNFLDLADEEYDRIVMNPPFEKLQDVDHLKQAYDLLAPGGKVVSVMSESPFFQQQKKAKDFRDWLDERDGYSEKLPAGSFKNSERSTGVNTRLVVLEKPEDEKKKRKVNYSRSRNSHIVRFSRPNSVALVLAN